MKQLLSTSLLATVLTLSATAATPAAAQSDVLLRLRSGSPAGDRFRVDSAGGVVARGSLGIGIIPFTGTGERMMWYPYKGAFRAGSVSGTQWDDANIGFYSFAGGYNATASQIAAVALGYEASASGTYATALGFNVNAAGTGAVAIGWRSTADANNAVAIGTRASANGFQGAIVIADASTTDSLEASANHEFSLRAAGGIRLYSNATETTGVTIAAGGSSWNVVSDRNRKEGFAPVDGADVLARIRALPVTTWRYTGEQDRTVRHIGPMAQDWQRAFGFSTDGTTINMSDFDGVNLAAIQALDRANTAQDGEISALRQENAELRAHNAQLEARLRRLEALAAPATNP